MFGRVLSLGWYDGTTSGLAECSSCSSVFKYDLVDWDADQEQRVFALSRLDRESFERIVEILKAFESPKWPFWNPRWWNIKQPEVAERARSQVDECLSRAAEPEFLVASDRQLKNLFGMAGITDAIRAKLPKQFDGLPVTDDFDSWMAYLAGK